jgi:outer membrane protein
MIRQLAIIIITAIASISTAQQTMSLNDAIEFAMTNHTEVRIAQLEMQDAEWQIKENRSVALPQLSLGITGTRFIEQPALPAEALGFEAPPGTKLKFALKNNIAGKVGVNQLLFNSSYLASIKAARMYRDLVSLQLNAAKEKVRNQVIDAYVPALVLSESIEVMDRNIENQQKLFGETQATYKAGFIELLDVDRVEYLLSTLKSDRGTLVRQREILIDALKFAMNMPISDSITLSDDIDMLLTAYGDIDLTEELNYMNRADYVSLLKTRELSQVQVEVYQKDWLPTVSLFASYDPSFQGNDKLFWIPSSIIGVSINMPIYDGGLSRAKEERAAIEALKIDEQKNMLTRAYDLEIESARKQYNNAKQRLEDQERNLALAKRIHDTSQTKFREGVGSSFEVTQAQFGYYQAQAAWINARFEYLNSIIGLRQALGKA